MATENGKWLAVLLILVLAGLIWLQGEAFRDEMAGAARVADGDSLEIAGERIRLKGIDAPELAQNCRRDGASWACGRAAQKALSRKINGQPVSCEGAEFDRHERLLAYCKANGVALNQWMVEEGWAVSYGASFKAEERAAKAARRGLWAGEFEMPHIWRRQNPRF